MIQKNEHWLQTVGPPVNVCRINAGLGDKIQPLLPARKINGLSLLLASPVSQCAHESSQMQSNRRRRSQTFVEA